MIGGACVAFASNGTTASCITRLAGRAGRRTWAGRRRASFGTVAAAAADAAADADAGAVAAAAAADAADAVAAAADAADTDAAAVVVAFVRQFVRQ